MEYLVFDRENKKLFYRDSLTTTTDRISYDVIFFSQQDNQYIFDIEPKPIFKFNRIFFPIQNTVLMII